MRISIEGARKYSVALPDRSQIAENFLALSKSAGGLLLFFAVLYAIGFVIKTVSNWISKFNRQAKRPWRPLKGRSVRDRSLGGREVNSSLSDTIDHTIHPFRCSFLQKPWIGIHWELIRRP